MAQTNDCGLTTMDHLTNDYFAPPHLPLDPSRPGKPALAPLSALRSLHRHGLLRGRPRHPDCRWGEIVAGKLYSGREKSHSVFALFFISN
jgi:hypothetical protein